MLSRSIITAILTISLLAPSACAWADYKQDDRIHLTHEKVVDLVLERSFGLKQAEMTRDMVYEEIPTAKSVFDTFLQAETMHNINKFQRKSPTFGTRTDTTDWNLSLTKEIPTGTTLGVWFKNKRDRTFGSNVGGVQIIPATPLYEPVFGFSLSQPILQNYFGANDRRGVEQAKFSYDSADYQLKRETDLTVYEALMDYWSLIFIRKHITAQERAVRFAREFLNTMDEERKLGTAEETDLLDARANLLSRRDELLTLREYERIAVERLRRDLEFEPNVDIRMSLKLPRFHTAGNMSEGRLEQAFANRGDYQSLLADLDRLNVALAVAKNIRWPKLDIYSTLELNDIDPSYSKALGNVDSPNWTIGMGFSIPLENRAARAGTRKAKSQKARAIFALKDLENKIVNEMTRLIAEVKARKRIVETSARTLTTQRKKLNEEMKKYYQARSSSFIIVRYQNDTISADRHLVEAWLAYRNSVLGLLLAEGTIVERELKGIKERDVK